MNTTKGAIETMDSSNNRTIDIASKEFWIQAWNDTLAGTPIKVHSGYATPRFWDNAAKDYDNGSDEKRDRETVALIGLLRDRGVTIDGARVLDIGCGTGRLAVAFAGEGADVTATDFSAAMLAELEKKLDVSLKGAVHPLQVDWETVDLDAMGWVKAFDLVIAHMTPAVRRPEAFLRMIEASRSFCMLKGWAGRRDKEVLSKLWKDVMGEPMRDRTPDVIFEFNLLYAMGYYPDMRIEEICHERHTTVGDAVTRYCDYFHGVSERPRNEIEAAIRPRLEKLASDGVIREKTVGRTGMMIWKV